MKRSFLSAPWNSLTGEEVDTALNQHSLFAVRLGRLSVLVNCSFFFFFFVFARLTTKEVLSEHTRERKSRERKRKVKERKKVKVMNERNIPHIRRTCPGHVRRGKERVERSQANAHKRENTKRERLMKVNIVTYEAPESVH